MTKSTPTSAKDLLEALESDSDFQAMRLEQERNRLKRMEALIQEQAPIMQDLHKVGIIETNLGDLMMRGKPYPMAIDTLLHHFLLPYSDQTRNILARCLAVPDAKFAWPVLRAEYLKLPAISSPSAKDGIAVALSATATDMNFADVADLLRDRSQGPTRIYLLKYLWRSKNPLAIQLIEDLSSDSDLYKEIASWKKKRKR